MGIEPQTRICIGIARFDIAIWLRWELAHLVLSYTIIGICTYVVVVKSDFFYNHHKAPDINSLRRNEELRERNGILSGSC